MNALTAIHRNAVIVRAGQRCEYCQLTSLFQIGGFELDHVLPRSRGGLTDLENLAFACPHCNLRKSDHVDQVDPYSGQRVALFNPRQDSWHDHFEWSLDAPFTLFGKTACGRATIQRLDLNDGELIRLRSLLAELGFDCRKVDFA